MENYPFWTVPAVFYNPFTASKQHSERHCENVQRHKKIYSVQCHLQASRVPSQIDIFFLMSPTYLPSESALYTQGSTFSDSFGLAVPKMNTIYVTGYMKGLILSFKLLVIHLLAPVKKYSKGILGAGIALCCQPFVCKIINWKKTSIWIFFKVY